VSSDIQATRTPIVPKAAPPPESSAMSLTLARSDLMRGRNFIAGEWRIRSAGRWHDVSDRRGSFLPGFRTAARPMQKRQFDAAHGRV